MARASASAHRGQMTASHDDIQSVLRPFLALLSGHAPLTLPLDTFYGGLTHFIGNLPFNDLAEFLRAIADSKHVWEHPQRAKEAIKLGVISKLGPATQNNGKGKGKAPWWSFGKREDEIWAEATTDVLLRLPEGERRTWMLISVLDGMGSAGYEGATREKVEEEVVLMIAQIQDSGDGPSWDDLIASIPCISSTRLQALDLHLLSAALVDDLYRRLESDEPPDQMKDDDIADLAKALARVCQIMLGGSQDNKHAALELATVLCQRTRELQQHPPHTNVSNQGFEVEKRRLFAFLLPTLAVLPFLLSNISLPVSSRWSRNQIAIDILSTLSTFATLLAQSEGGVEGYHRLLYGSLDIIAAGGSSQVRELLQIPHRRVLDMGLQEAGWWLSVCESLVHQLDGWSVREVVIPLVQQCIYQVDETSTFESAHAMIIALLKAATDVGVIGAQEAFLSQLVLWYAPLILSQAHKGHVSLDQLCAAYLVVVQAGSKLPTDLSPITLDLLRNSTERMDDEWRRTLLRTRIFIAPAVSSDRLKDWLLQINHDMSASPLALRSETESVAFKMIMEELPDASRRIGMEWWGEYHSSKHFAASSSA